MGKNKGDFFRPVREKEEIELFIKEKDKTIIICWAPWCKPCQVLRDEFQKLYEAFPFVSFGWLNVDSYIINLQKVCADRLGLETFYISQIPSILHFKKNDIIIIEGFEDIEKLIGELHKIL